MKLIIMKDIEENPFEIRAADDVVTRKPVVSDVIEPITGYTVFKCKNIFGRYYPAIAEVLIPSKSIDVLPSFSRVHRTNTFIIKEIKKRSMFDRCYSWRHDTRYKKNHIYTETELNTTSDYDYAPGLHFYGNYAHAEK